MGLIYHWKYSEMEKMPKGRQRRQNILSRTGQVVDMLSKRFKWFTWATLVTALLLAPVAWPAVRWSAKLRAVVWMPGIGCQERCEGKHRLHMLSFTWDVLILIFWVLLQIMTCLAEIPGTYLRPGLRLLFLKLKFYWCSLLLMCRYAIVLNNDSSSASPSSDHIATSK